jgi:hypothetical protein
MLGSLVGRYTEPKSSQTNVEIALFASDADFMVATVREHDISHFATNEARLIWAAHEPLSPTIHASPCFDIAYERQGSSCPVPKPPLTRGAPAYEITTHPRNKAYDIAYCLCTSSIFHTRPRGRFSERSDFKIARGKRRCGPLPYPAAGSGGHALWHLAWSLATDATRQTNTKDNKSRNAACTPKIFIIHAQARPETLA